MTNSFISNAMVIPTPKRVLMSMSLRNQQVSELLENVPGIVVAGGAARYEILSVPGEAPEPSDIDLFLLTAASSGLAMAGLRILGYHCYGEWKGQFHYERAGGLNVQLMTNGGTIVGGQTPLQWNTAWEVICTFGFTTEMFALHRDLDDPLVWGTYTHDAEHDTLDRRLVVNHIIDPVRLAYRMNKYGRKGYTVKPAEVLGVFKHWSALTDEQRKAIEADINDETYRLAMGEQRA